MEVALRASREQLQVATRRLMETQEMERRAMSRDLHDTSGQNITVLKLGLAALKREGGCTEAMRARADDLIQLADRIAEDLHRVAVNLRPASLDRYGLVPALEQLLTEFRKQTGLQVQFLAEGMEDEGRLPPDTETALYRIVQEATTNCARYAQATRVSVMVQHFGEEVRLIVEDDGRGFDVEAALHSGRLGLQGIARAGRDARRHAGARERSGRRRLRLCERACSSHRRDAAAARLQAGRARTGDLGRRGWVRLAPGLGGVCPRCPRRCQGFRLPRAGTAQESL